MSARSLFGTVVLSGLVLSGLAGCGSGVAGSPAARATPAAPAVSPGHHASAVGSVNPGGPDIPASPASPAPSAPGTACGGARLLPAPVDNAVLTLGNASNGGTFCIPAGERVDVYLTGPPGQRWTPVKSDSRSLVSVPSGRLMRPAGAAGAFFAALQQGIAHLSSARQVCLAKPVHCDALIAFRATVIVSGHA